MTTCMGTLVTKAFAGVPENPFPFSVRPDPEMTRPLGPGEVIHVVVADNVDRSREVVIPTGGDLSEFLANPVVTYNHSDDHDEIMLLPVGKSLGLMVTPDGRHLISRTRFDLDDAFAARVAGQVKREFLNSWSVKFLPLEFGPPTSTELRERPDWARAKTIYRKWKLVAFSVVILPDNPHAVTIMKALDEPSQAHSKGKVSYKGHPESDAEWDAAKARRQFEAYAGGKGDNFDPAKYAQGFAAVVGPPDELGSYKFPHHYIEGGKIVTVRQGVASAIAACRGARSGGTPEGADAALKHLLEHARELGLPSGEETKSMKPAEDEGGPGEPDADDLVTKGMHVKCYKSMGGGCGVVKAIHTEGMHLAADDQPIEASHDEPVVEVDRHDADHEPTGETKKYRPQHLRPFGDDEDESESKGLGMVESVGALGGYATHGEPDADDEPEPEPKTPRAGHYVKFDTGRVRGVGKLISVHKGEMVPDVDDDIMGTDEDPGVRVQVHKKVDDGHKPTGLHVGCRLSQIAKTEALRPPTARKSAGTSYSYSAPSSKASAPPQSPPQRVLRFTPVSPAEQARRRQEWLESPEGTAAFRKALEHLEAKRSGAI